LSEGENVAKHCIVLLLTVLLLLAIDVYALENTQPFSSPVDAKGTITLPADFRSTWIHLGTWLMTAPLPAGSGLEKTAPGPGFHTVYTHPDALTAYRKAGTWPDGAVIIMEVRTVQWDDLPTGHVMRQGDPVKWFVMVKDAKGRYPGNPQWGDGWGWALFNKSDPKQNASTGYKKDCIGCHDVAKGTDWVFVTGYPVLR
jgi:hypothetical protein